MGNHPMNTPSEPVGIKPLEALALLDRAASLATGTRQDHINIQLALKSLAEFVDKHSPRAAPPLSVIKDDDDE